MKEERWTSGEAGRSDHLLLMVDRALKQAAS